MDRSDAFLLRDFHFQPSKCLACLVDSEWCFTVQWTIGWDCTAEALEALYTSAGLLQGWRLAGAELCLGLLGLGPVFPRLMVSLKSPDASANGSTIDCRSFSWCAIRAQSSAKRASVMNFSAVLVWAQRRRGSKTEPSERHLTCKSRSRSFTVWSIGPARKTSWTGMGASTESCLTPLQWRCWKSTCSHHWRELGRSCCRGGVLSVWWTCVGKLA